MRVKEALEKLLPSFQDILLQWTIQEEVGN